MVSLNLEVRRLAKELTTLARRVKSMERASQARYRSIEGGAQTVYDDDGQVRQQAGQQADGTYTTVDMNAPAPVAPSPPWVDSSKSGVLVVTWDGATEDGSDWLSDWTRVEVHVDTVTPVVPTDENQVATFTSRKGGSVTLALDAARYYVTLTSANTSGAESGPSVEGSGTVQAAATGTGGVKTYAVPDAPVGLTVDDDGAIWWDTDNENQVSRWDGATLTWVLVRDAGISTALADAATATTKADNAQTTADQAQTDATAAQTTADNANSAAATAQSAADAAQADATAADQKATDAATAAQAAKDAAAAAQSDADAANQQALDAANIAAGKGTVYHQGAAPAGDPNGLWIDSANGNVAKTWDGTSWVVSQDADIQAAANAAATADNKADTAQAKADQAASDAATAQTAADAADQKAVNAQSAADAAQSTADTAKTNAAAAQTAADNAQAAADAADTKAVNAQAAADAAQSAANQAQADADAANQQALDAAGIANSKGTVYYQPAAPAGDANGLWIDSDAGNLAHTWDGSTWQPTQDADIQAAANAAAAADSKADTAQSAATTAQSKADQAAADAATADQKAVDAQTAADAAKAAASTAQNRADSAYTLADGKIQTFYSTSDPAGDAANNVQAGDLWWDQNRQKLKRRTTTGTWSVLTDAGISDAIAAADGAQATADGKVTTFYSDTAPTAEADGDLWVDTSADNLVNRWDGLGGVWVQLTVGSGAIGDGAIQGQHLTQDLVLSTRLIGGTPTGARAEMNAQGFQAYNPAGVRTVDVDSSTGEMTVTGKITSGSEVEAKVRLTPQAFSDSAGQWQPGIEWVPGRADLVGVSGAHGGQFVLDDDWVNPGETKHRQVMRLYGPRNPTDAPNVGGDIGRAFLSLWDSGQLQGIGSVIRWDAASAADSSGSYYEGVSNRAGMYVDDGGGALATTLEVTPIWVHGIAAETYLESKDSSGAHSLLFGHSTYAGLYLYDSANTQISHVIAQQSGVHILGDDVQVDGRVIIGDTSDANSGAGNAPSLRIGDVNGYHLRVDGNEIICMSSDTTQDTLVLNSGSRVALGSGGGSASIGAGPYISGIDFGTFQGSDSIGNFRVSHSLGVAPTAVIVTPDTDLSNGGEGFHATVSSLDAGAFSMHVNDDTGSNVSKTVKVHWIAIA